MAIILSPEQLQTIDETKPATSVEEFNAIRQAVDTELKKALAKHPIQERNQPVDRTLDTLRSLYLLVSRHAPLLASKGYREDARAFFRDSIRLLDTTQMWFATGLREGSYRPLSISKTLEASLSWRSELRHAGRAAFPYDPDIAERFADVNSSGTIKEEREDLDDLLKLLEAHKTELKEQGLDTEAFAAKGRELLEGASGHGLLKSLGLGDQQEAQALRALLLTFAVIQGRRALASGRYAFLHEPGEDQQRFLSLSLGSALRSHQERKRATAQTPGAPVPAEQTSEEPASV